jgi:hypothetical protein
MTKKNFRLPGSSYVQLTKIIQAYYELGDDTTINNIKTYYNIPAENTSRNLGFLLQIGVISGNKIKKKITEKGIEIGKALKENDRAKISAFWRKVINEIEVFDKLKSILGSQGSIDSLTLKNIIIVLAGESNTFRTDLGAQTIIDILEDIGLLRKISFERNIPSYILNNNTPHQKSYVGLDRLAQLQEIKSEEFDLAKLVELCKELNSNYANEYYLAVAMLVRAILDHIPPIFNCEDFSKVSNNYAGGKSFKKSMQNLELSSRPISDHALHSQIRKSEVLPNKNQVDFSSELDVLLAEIFRLLKK